MVSRSKPLPGAQLCSLLLLAILLLLSLADEARGSSGGCGFWRLSVSFSGPERENQWREPPVCACSQCDQAVALEWDQPGSPAAAYGRGVLAKLEGLLLTISLA